MRSYKILERVFSDGRSEFFPMYKDDGVAGYSFPERVNGQMVDRVLEWSYMLTPGQNIVSCWDMREAQTCIREDKKIEKWRNRSTEVVSEIDHTVE